MSIAAEFTDRARVRPSAEALINAARLGDLKQFADLLDRGAPVNGRHEGETALLAVSKLGDQKTGLEMAKLLLERNVDVNDTRSSNGTTALHSAAQYANDGLARMLVQNGAKVNAKSGSGRTPLMNAEDGASALSAQSPSENGGAYSIIAQMLRRAGADDEKPAAKPLKL